MVLPAERDAADQDRQGDPAHGMGQPAAGAADRWAAGVVDPPDAPIPIPSATVRLAASDPARAGSGAGHWGRGDWAGQEAGWGANRSAAQPLAAGDGWGRRGAAIRCVAGGRGDPAADAAIHYRSVQCAAGARRADAAARQDDPISNRSGAARPAVADPARVGSAVRPPTAGAVVR